MKFPSKIDAAELSFSQFLDEFKILFAHFSLVSQLGLRRRFGLVAQKRGKSLFRLIRAKTLVGVGSRRGFFKCSIDFSSRVSGSKEALLKLRNF